MNIVRNDVFSYLENSYKYYIAFDDCDLSDEQFDWLCYQLYKRWDELTEYEQSLLDKDSLNAGTGFNIPLAVYKEVGVC